MQWIKGMLNGTHPKSLTGYTNAIKLRFEDGEARDEAYSSLEKVPYQGCNREMFLQFQMNNDEAMVTEAAFKKLILQWLPYKILEQMSTFDLTGKTDSDIIGIISSAGRTAEKWDKAKKSLGLKKTPVDKENKPWSSFQPWNRDNNFQRKPQSRFQKNNQKSCLKKQNTGTIQK